MERGKGSTSYDRSQAQQHAWHVACREVSARTVNARCRVARTLGDCGPASLDPLCGALFDPALKVRRAAARSLDALGDPRALPPLRLALQSTMLGGGPSAHRAAGWSLMILALIAQLGFVAESIFQEKHRSLAVAALCFYGILTVGVHLTRAWADNRDDLRWSLVAALAAIATRDGGPEARTILPELDALSQTPFARSPRGKKQLRQALEVIRSLPELMPLPIPAARENAGTSDLPIAPERSSSAAQRLLLPIPDDPR